MMGSRATGIIAVFAAIALLYYVLFVLLTLPSDSVFLDALQLVLWCGGFFTLSLGLAHIGDTIVRGGSE